MSLSASPFHWCTWKDHTQLVHQQVTSVRTCPKNNIFWVPLSYSIVCQIALWLPHEGSFNPLLCVNKNIHKLALGMTSSTQCLPSFRSDAQGLLHGRTCTQLFSRTLSMREQFCLVIGCPNLPNLPILVYLVCLTLPKVTYM